MIEFTLAQIFQNLLLAARWTVVLSIVSFVLGGVVGFALLVMRVSKSKMLRTLVKGYIQIFQGTPLLMQLFLVFFGLPLLGIEVSPWLAATVGFAVQAVKDTALVSIIGFTELTKAGTMISNATFRPFLVYGIVAVIYFVLCYPLTRYARTLERKWNAAR